MKRKLKNLLEAGFFISSEQEDRVNE